MISLFTNINLYLIFFHCLEVYRDQEDAPAGFSILAKHNLLCLRFGMRLFLLLATWRADKYLPESRQPTSW